MSVSVSVIIPCYNVEKYIREAVQSVLDQKEVVLEIICVDDCSTDKTPAILEELKSTHPELISVFKNESNQGATFSRNRGLAEAKGNYIQFLDADDLLMKEKIAHQLKLFKEQNKRPGIIVADYFRKDTVGNEKAIHAQCENPWIGLMNTRLGITSSNLWKKADLEKVNGFDLKLQSSQEYDLMFRLMKNDISIIHDSVPMTIVRDRVEGSISKLNKAENWKRFVKLRCDIVSYLSSTGQLNDSNRHTYFQLIFDAIRSWYPYSPKEAFETYKEFIPAGFVPETSLVTSENYRRLYRMFGFKMAEKLKSLKSFL